MWPLDGHECIVCPSADGPITQDMHRAYDTRPHGTLRYSDYRGCQNVLGSAYQHYFVGTQKKTIRSRPLLGKKRWEPTGQS